MIKFLTFSEKNHLIEYSGLIFLQLICIILSNILISDLNRSLRKSEILCCGKIYRSCFSASLCIKWAKKKEIVSHLQEIQTKLSIDIRASPFHLAVTKASLPLGSHQSLPSTWQSPKPPLHLAVTKASPPLGSHQSLPFTWQSSKLPLHLAGIKASPPLMAVIKASLSLGRHQSLPSTNGSHQSFPFTWQAS